MVGEMLNKHIASEKAEQVEEHAHVALGTASATEGPHMHTVSARRNLMLVLAARGKHHQAIALGHRQLDDVRQLVGPIHPMTLSALKDVTSVLLSVNAFSLALPLLREAVESSREFFGSEQHEDVLAFRMLLGQALGAQGLSAEAHPVLRASWITAKQLYGEDAEQTLLAGSSLAAVLMELGGYCEAEALLECYADVSEKVHGTKSAQAREAKSRLKHCRALIAKSWWYRHRSTSSSTSEITAVGSRS